jgi:prepilin-type N-terminal cleavage/methylation domain-containing protein
MNRTAQERGFTLLEMLVAAGITALLAAIMLTIVVTALNSWSRAQGLLAAEGQARLALDQLAFDLESALSRNDGSVWLAMTVERDPAAVAAGRPEIADLSATQSAESPNVVAGARFGSRGAWLRFIAGASAFSFGNSAPVAVSYQISRLPEDPGATSSSDPHRWRLYRKESSPISLLEQGYDLNPASSTPAPYIAALRETALKDVLADNVVDFGAWFYVRNSNATLERIVSVADGATATFPNSTTPFPDAMDIMIRVLTPEGVQQIQARETGRTSADWWEIVVRHSKVYTRRINLRARGI